jgi:hypothetical protein
MGDKNQQDREIRAPGLGELPDDQQDLRPGQQPGGQNRPDQGQRTPGQANETPGRNRDDQRSDQGRDE